MFLGIPLVWVLVDGISGQSGLPLAVWTAALYSGFVALGTTAICLVIVFSLLNRNSEVLATLGIAVSPIVLGAGLFLIRRPFVNPFDIGLIVTLRVNA